MRPLRVAFLWHQHQPLYRSPRSGRYSLPWVRLHGLKDYYDMAALAGEFPRLRLTINLVPSLLDQIDDYAAGTALDPALDLARRSAEDLDEEERLALFDLFFSVPYRTLIAPYPRYAALYHKRGERGSDGAYRDALSRFKPADLRDLQVWFHLAWCGRTLRARKQVHDLIVRGDNFTEQDKLGLLDTLDAFLGEIVPIHRRLRETGIAEISTTPYYHPILPLVIDQDCAREAIHDMPLPEVPLRRPADAAWQVRRALELTEQRLGVRPAGMWPAEGGLSEAALRLMGECGVRWTASDEGVLRASLGGDAGPGSAYGAWHLPSAGEGSPAIFFRDTGLSDLIGFTYASWPAPDAAADFMAHLRRIARDHPGGIVSVILDGENAWEYYPDNGTAFLRALYDALTRTPDIQTVTFSEALAEAAPPGRLARLRAGSWIGSSFGTWIGHPEKNKAWSLLAQARNEAERRLGDELESSEVFAALAAAEGSDWFWWFGDDHSSEQDAIFDTSFRDLLRGVYQMLEAPAPEALDRPIKKVRARTWTPPTGPVHPSLDGVVSDYFEWLTAGVCDATTGQGAMHQTAGLLRGIAFGSDGRSLYVRIDPERGDVRALLDSLPGGTLSVEITAPAWANARFHLEEERISHRGSDLAVRYAAGKVLEVEMPLPDPSSTVQFFVSLSSAGGTVQRLPRDGAILFNPGEQPDWSV